MLMLLCIQPDIYAEGRKDEISPGILQNIKQSPEAFFGIPVVVPLYPPALTNFPGFLG
ncbi:MAG: hypothetical protein IAA96_06215 [Spirochaetes bacterium]|uniref:Uncharacterized protein n=1 Tax=Candidatus Avitreponema avistercoris TaxID=2840705 RepID=A0A9D9EPH0_9SPIR|nr:hypothetical protein [Candidatus Avitreponema avistercoris]